MLNLNPPSLSPFSPFAPLLSSQPTPPLLLFSLTFSMLTRQPRYEATRKEEAQ